MGKQPVYHRALAHPVYNKELLIMNIHPVFKHLVEIMVHPVYKHLPLMRHTVYKHLIEIMVHPVYNKYLIIMMHPVYKHLPMRRNPVFQLTTVLIVIKDCPNLKHR
uniref:Uncharacterized protein n=1 Tax=Cacopsylla melanoneura TaxID=428564 RepID=A0A8D8SQ55_9HEMI